LPGCFDDVLLDVPVGTGVFTAEFYGRYPDATIIGIDCSLNMLRKARTRFQGHGLENVCLIKADAASLPVGDGAVDIVLSMNGWHAFADKRRTVAEMRRVLRQDGKLVACGYVTGARRLSDSFVRHFGVRNGFFTPPFFTADELTRQFEGFTIVRQGSDKSIAYLEAVNRGDCRTV
jgi:ubiquinone/menaquinone biosynthesis C-methylase UbiE